MKLSSIVTITATTVLYTSHGVSGNAWVRIGRRDQEDEYGSLVSGIRQNAQWCVAASNGVAVGAEVGFKRCNGSNRQLWHYGDDNKLHSKVNPSRCLSVENGSTSAVKDGAHIKIASCDKATSFMYDVDTAADLIQVKSNTKFCVVNTGITPESSDIMIIKPCSTSEKRFQFTYKKPLEYHGYALDWTPSGCLEVKDQNPRSGQPLILGDCSKNYRWRLDSSNNFHTQLNDGMCMQADPAEGQAIGKGVPLRLYPCDAKKSYQKFLIELGGGIYLKDYPDWCVGFQGNTANVGSDPLVLKDCDSDGNAWSSDR